MIEFTVVFALVLLPALMSVFEFAQLAVARANLRYAVFDTVRMAEAEPLTDSIDMANLRWRLSRALLPSLANETTTDPAALATAAAFAARMDLLTVDYRAIDTASTSAAAPHAASTTTFGTWELEVRWCRELYFAPIKYWIPSVLRFSSTSWFDEACYARQSVPLKAKAYVLRAIPPATVTSPSPLSVPPSPST
ncbi:MAG: hypothetical protein RLY56_71 [Pseudomonadota bacterium]